MVDRDDNQSPLPVGTPGALIRQARERRGLSLDILFQETRIPVRMLEAIERDDFDQLSGPLYARSFLRTLARSLELDEQQLLSLYERFLKEEEPTVPPDQTWEEEVSVERIGLLSALPRRHLLAGGGIVLGAALVIWLGLRVLGGGCDGEAPVDRPPQPAAVTPTPADTAVATAATDTAAADADTVSGAPAALAPTVVLPDSAALRSLLVRPDPAELAATAALPAGTPELAFAGGKHYPLVLRIVTRERIDLDVAVDAQTAPVPADWTRSDRPGLPHSGIVPGRVYAAGRRYVVYWGADDHFIVRLGAASGVTVTLNGRPLVISRRQLGREWVLDATAVAGP